MRKPWFFHFTLRPSLERFLSPRSLPGACMGCPRGLEPLCWRVVTSSLKTPPPFPAGSSIPTLGSILLAFPAAGPVGGRTLKLSPSKVAFLKLSKTMGLFDVSRRVTERSLRILCYHGTAMQDECAFRPQLFIDPSVFERRCAYLAKSGFPILSLDEGVERLRHGTIPPNATVITIDDGFYSTFKHAIPTLVKYGLPATLYVTTYYSQKEAPIFRLLLQYVFWASPQTTLRLTRLGLPGFEEVGFISSDRENDPLLWRITRYAEVHLTEPERGELAKKLAAELGVRIDGLTAQRILGLMTSDEIRQASKAGIDIQLHTHRHRLPVERASVRREIEDNRAVLEPLVGKALNHFCYPSGEWSERQLPWLEELGVKSATTCDVGFNALDARPLALKRVFDSAEVSDVQFDAEMNGYLELLRIAKASVKRVGSEVRAAVPRFDRSSPTR